MVDSESKVKVVSGQGEKKLNKTPRTYSSTAHIREYYHSSAFRYVCVFLRNSLKDRMWFANKNIVFDIFGNNIASTQAETHINAHTYPQDHA